MKSRKEKIKPFNNPMALSLKSLRDTLKEQQEVKQIKVVQKPPEPDSGVSDEDLFASVMSDVKPLGSFPLPTTVTPAIRHAKSDDDEVIAALDGLVSGNRPFDIQDTGEYVERCVHELDRRILKRLKSGEFSREFEIDLHNMTVEEAKKAIVSVVHSSKTMGRRCLKVIHGRGLHSKDHTPVIKESVTRWLSHGSLAGQVLAFCSAQPNDGGLGALYVLLRK